MGQGLSPIKAGASSPERLIRVRARVRGIVQGVGFRPFVHNLAKSLGLAGQVANDAQGVDLAVQGPAGAVEEFFRRLISQAPPLARILEVERRDREPRPGQEGFAITASSPGVRRTLISPDVAVCEACLAEMLDPADRRHNYPFINCTHCGPRFTIIEDLPYDRPLTTMAGFTMCPACLAEYHDPADRRFHAQPNACPVCGPRVWAADPSGRDLGLADPVAHAAAVLAQGGIVAVKGLGGFHLAADAANPAAVTLLRARKHRDEKPLAVMVPDAAAAQALAHLDPPSREALTSRERPIVLVPLREDAPLAPEVAPHNRLVGLMLPYTPLHYLLLAQSPPALVMTSGNLSEEPICQDNQEALTRLGGTAGAAPVADLLLLHDRGIHQRADDSVVRVMGGRVRFFRRSRGYVPIPLLLSPAVAPPEGPVVLAVGAQQKNTLCLLRGREAFLSQHVGDLDDLGALEFFEQAAGHLARVLEAPPAVLAADLHPDYLATRWAQEQAQEQGLPLIQVQHHHAHLASVMAEHGLTGQVVGLALDGTGYGPDHTIWGGELLVAGYQGYRRLGRLRRFALPGGERAVKEPWRVGLALLLELMTPDEVAALNLPLAARHADKLPLLAGMIAGKLNAPLTSSLGRLFDGVAALAGLRDVVRYEGQAAVELEQAAPPGAGLGWDGACPFALTREDGLLVLDWGPAILALAAAAAAGESLANMAARFHAGLVAGLARLAAAGAREAGLDRVALGGGCLLNEHLLTGLTAELERQGLTVYTQAQTPAGDGGLALGQAVVAAAALWQGI